MRKRHINAQQIADWGIATRVWIVNLCLFAITIEIVLAILELGN